MPVFDALRGRHWTDLLLVLYYAGFVVVGALGFTDPSVSMRNVLGASHVVFAVGMIMVGTLALMSLLQRSRRSEAVCIVVFGALSVLHGLIVAVGTPNGGGVQTGTRLIIALPASVVFAYLRSEMVLTRRDLREQIRRAEVGRAAAAEAVGGVADVV